MKKIACCTDFSRNADAAVDAAVEMAEKFRARLYLIHVLPRVLNPLLADTEWMLPGEPKSSLILKLQERMANAYGTKIARGIEYKIVVLDGHISTEILGYLERVGMDLVVLGSYGLSGMDLVVFGSVAKRVAHKAPCSVMIVRMPAKATPSG